MGHPVNCADARLSDLRRCETTVGGSRPVSLTVQGTAVGCLRPPRRFFRGTAGGNAKARTPQGAKKKLRAFAPWRLRVPAGRALTSKPPPENLISAHPASPI